MALILQQLLQRFNECEAKAKELHPIFRGPLWGKLKAYPLHVLFFKLLFKLCPGAERHWLVKNSLFTGNTFYTEAYFMDYYLCGIIGEDNERALTKWLLQNVGQKSEVFFDVGAHYGYYSLVVATLLNNKPHSIYAFEPTPTTQAVLQKNLHVCKHAQLVKTALGQHNGERPLNIYAAGSKRGSNSFFLQDPVHNTTFPLSVPIQTMDEFCKQHNIWPTLIKLDIENAELDALLGAQHVLQKAKPRVLMEVWPHPNNKQHQQAAYLLNNLGYTLYGLDEFGQTHLINLNTWFKQVSKIENIIALV
ncbi:FkbM family methyltransferase [bacterium]|nr:FkbM family methyltransferase [bacterium]